MDISIQIENLFRKDRGRLLSFIRERVRSKEDAEDILQDVMANVLSAKENDKIENIGAWVFTSVKNKIIDWYRKKKTTNFTDLVKDDDAEMIMDNLLSDISFNPERAFTRKAIRQDLDKALKSLPDEQRYAFVKNELEGMTFRDMADETGENINTLLARKRYAVMALRKSLQGHYNNISY